MELAIQILLQAKEVAEINLPISLKEFEMEQARLQETTIEQCKEAISFLQGIQEGSEEKQLTDKTGW